MHKCLRHALVLSLICCANTGHALNKTELCPGIFHTTHADQRVHFRYEEDQLLDNALALYGQDWARISWQAFRGTRSPCSLRHRFIYRNLARRQHIAQPPVYQEAPPSTERAASIDIGHSYTFEDWRWFIETLARLRGQRVQDFTWPRKDKDGLVTREHLKDWGSDPRLDEGKFLTKGQDSFFE